MPQLTLFCGDFNGCSSRERISVPCPNFMPDCRSEIVFSDLMSTRPADRRPKVLKKQNILSSPPLESKANKEPQEPAIHRISEGEMISFITENRCVSNSLPRRGQNHKSWGAEFLQPSPSLLVVRTVSQGCMGQPDFCNILSSLFGDLSINLVV